MLFTKIAATTGFYLHPYFCFRKHANSDHGSTCGFNNGPVAAVTTVAKVLHQTHVPTVLAVAHVPVTATATTAEVFAFTGVPKVLEIAHVPAVLTVPAIGQVEYNLHTWNILTSNSKMEYPNLDYLICPN